MKVAIISDTHGCVAPQILDLIRGSDLCVHAGDIGNYAVIAQLESENRPVFAVLGNNDVPTKWPAKDCTFLTQLPSQQAIELPGGRLCVEHGHKINPVKSRHDKFRRKYPDARAVVYGHSHRLVCDQDAKPWILNPGAAGRSRTFGGASCIILTVSTSNRWTVKPYRITK